MIRQEGINETLANLCVSWRLCADPLRLHSSGTNLTQKRKPGRTRRHLLARPGILSILLTKRVEPNYFTSTVAPASVNFFWIAAASSLLTPSLIGFGAPSTRSLASFKPRLVTSRTALITLILFAPTPVRMTLNSVFSSAGAAAAAAPPPPAIITGAAAAAETPSFSSSRFTSAAASSSDSPTICSSNCCKSAMTVSPYLYSRRDVANYVSTRLNFDFAIRSQSFQCSQASELPRQTTQQNRNRATLDYEQPNPFGQLSLPRNL